MTESDKLFQAALAMLTSRIGAHVVIDVAIKDSVKEAKVFLKLLKEAENEISVSVNGTADTNVVSALPDDSDSL